MLTVRSAFDVGEIVLTRPAVLTQVSAAQGGVTRALEQGEPGANFSHLGRFSAQNL
jgi:hypothetical protein